MLRYICGFFDAILGSGSKNMRPLALRVRHRYGIDAIDYLSRRKYIESTIFIYTFFSIKSSAIKT
jgi:hypothetical protein